MFMWKLFLLCCGVMSGSSSKLPQYWKNMYKPMVDYNMENNVNSDYNMSPNDVQYDDYKFLEEDENIDEDMDLEKRHKSNMNYCYEKVDIIPQSNRYPNPLIKVHCLQGQEYNSIKLKNCENSVTTQMVLTNNKVIQEIIPIGCKNKPHFIYNI